MAIPESVTGALADVSRLLTFRGDVEVNVLVLYDEAGAEITRLDHWWRIEDSRPLRHLERPRDSGANSENHWLRITEDGTALDAAMSAVKTVRYEIPDGTTPVPLSDVYTVQVANRPDAGRNREWHLRATKEKFKGRYFRSPAR